MCCEPKNVEHLFFTCDISKIFWQELAVMLDVNHFLCYEDVARWWPSNNNHAVINMASSAFMWTLWKFRNDLHFGWGKWSGLQVIWHRILCLLKRWRVLCPKKRYAKLDKCLAALESKAAEAPRFLPC
ncbi:hypothetical protein BRADI_3g19082v3 [Brachypodium distachyon]|uniref:Reverse transcriptase zinc-binding domain-containing protein n=1 Tax=Brachypodium distachyon TaxID=15368 RepID=A0A0Q3F7Q8_BRADI|nr:hypothetical protein BRADI_3g19082v3 [Brachypodium distachyon]